MQILTFFVRSEMNLGCMHLSGGGDFICNSKVMRLSCKDKF